MLFALDYTNEIEVRAIKDIFRLALGSVMVSFSNYSYEPSLTRRSAVDKHPISDADVSLVIRKKLGLMAEDIEWLQEKMDGIAQQPIAKVYAKSFFSAFSKSSSAMLL